LKKKLAKAITTDELSFGRAFLLRLPSRRRRDGVRLHRDFIGYEMVERCVDPKQVSRFLRSFHRRWPFKISDEGEQQLTIGELIAQATFLPAPS
jgi:hypothetical protein